MLSPLHFLLHFGAFWTIGFAVSVQFVCPSESSLFLSSLELQCPGGFSSPMPLEVDGQFLAKALSAQQQGVYTSVLLYASWCPFSMHARSTFDVLSSMFPWINHFAVEESKMMPVMFSKLGIYSVPSIIMLGQTSRIHYRGGKNLDSLTVFYTKVTGYKPMLYFPSNLPDISAKGSILHIGPSFEVLKKEPFLAFSLLFLCLRGFLYFFPGILSPFLAVWFLCIRHVNLRFLRETSQLLERVGHFIDIKRAWSKLQLCKARKFRNGAKSARVWASSLASVSLSEASLSRSSTLES